MNGSSFFSKTFGSQTWSKNAYLLETSRLCLFVIYLNQLLLKNQPLFRVILIIVAHGGVCWLLFLSSQEHASIHTYEMYWMLIIFE